jgi:hypothetical protein
MGFALVEKVLRDVHNIDDAGAAQFRARLRNLPRVGLVVAPAAGAGRRPNFNLAGLFKLAFATELLQAGLPPESAAALAAHNWQSASDALLNAERDRRDGRAASRYLVMEPRLIARRGQLGVGRVRFKEMDAKQLAKMISSRDSLLETRLVILNMAALLIKITAAMHRAGVDPDDIHAELRAAVEEKAARGKVDLPKSGFIPAQETEDGDDQEA